MNTTCTELVVFMHSTGKSMNNLLSYCGLVDPRIDASDKNLPVPTAEVEKKKIKHQRPLILVGISQIRQKSSQIQLFGELKIFCDSKRTLNLLVGYGVMFNDSFPSYECLIIMEILQQWEECLSYDLDYEMIG